MGVSDHQSQTSEKEFDISRCIQSAIRRNGKFKWNCKDIAYPAMNVSLSKLEPCVKDSYNYHLCGTVKFKKADEDFRYGNLNEDKKIIIKSETSINVKEEDMIKTDVNQSEILCYWNCS